MPQRSAAGPGFYVALRAAHPVATLLEDDASRRVLPLQFSDALFLRSSLWCLTYAAALDPAERIRVNGHGLRRQ
ncbi:hypothetical protein CCUS01_01160 [Colletotrichum cuscutae]|uniref:Uncharacterized protein n=1 Tax=Colletotrichum cuscutae TaxID=1209917 RepID=A0AAI9UXE8_9PEZI|nr:hypothetical protein CCUS01_01160 [Colletotrichum cuscutae]